MTKPRVGDLAAKAVNQMRVLENARTHGSDERALEPRERVDPRGLVGNDDLRSLRGRRSANVGDPIGERRVDFVSDCADDGDSHCREATDDPLVVERHQVVVRTAASPDDEHVQPRVAFDAGRWRR